MPTFEQIDNSTVCVPMPQIYGKFKQFRFLDFTPSSLGGIYVSEDVKKQLDEVIPTAGTTSAGPVFAKNKVYLKAGGEHYPYYELFIPSCKFIDKNHVELLEGSKGIVYHGDCTDGLEDIVRHSFKAGTMKKMPEEARTIFKEDFHKVGWRFCLKRIKEKIEATGATGIEFVMSKDINWDEQSEKELSNIAL